MGASAGIDRFCPSCDSILRSWRVGPITVEGCDICGGVWFDTDELKTIAAMPGRPLEAVDGEFTAGLGGGGGGRHCCPADRTPLEPKQLRQAPEITIDVCPTCRGLWLEDGELTTLAAKLPKPAGRMPPPDPAAAGLSALAGLIRVVHCPSCDAENPDLELRCCECGADLHRPPAAGVGNLLSSHLAHPLVVVMQLALVALILAAVYLPSRGGPALVSLLAPGQRWLPAAVVLGLWLARWLVKCWRIDATTGGLVLHRLVGRRFVPWESLRSAVVTDLGGRAPWAAVVNFSPTRRRGVFRHGQYYSHDDYLESFGPLPMRVLMIVYTTRGIVLVGPDLTNHGALVDRIRAHLK